MAVSAFTVANIKPSLSIDSGAQRFIFGDPIAPEPLSEFKLDSIFVPVPGTPSQFNFEHRNNMFSGFRWVHETNDTDTWGALKLYRFEAADPVGELILTIGENIDFESETVFSGRFSLPNVVSVDGPFQNFLFADFGTSPASFNLINPSTPSGSPSLTYFSLENIYGGIFRLKHSTNTSATDTGKVGNLWFEAVTPAAVVYQFMNFVFSGTTRQVYIEGDTFFSSPVQLNNLGIGTSSISDIHAPLQFAASFAARKMVFYEVANNNHQFYGMGVTSNIFEFHVPSFSADYIFYSAVSSAVSTQVFRIKGTGYIGIGAAFDPHAPLHFSPDYLARKIVLYETANNNYQFHGFGAVSGALEYVVPSTSVDHVFYAATSSSARNEVGRIKGNGDMTVPGTLTVTGNIHGKRSSALMYMQGNATGTTITPAATWTKIAGTTTAVYLVDFTSPSSNRLTYTGTPTLKFYITADLTFSHNGLVTEELLFTIYINGSQVSDATMSHEIASSVLTNISISYIAPLSTNDYIEVWCESPTNTRVITVKRMMVIAQEVTT